jgi:hypothetical protein
MSALLQRLITWLCLGAALLSSVAPAQGFVVCLEPDGCIRVELAPEAVECGGCEGHEQERAPALGSSDAAGCPCVDVHVPGSTQTQRVLPKSIDLRVAWIAPSPSTVAQRDFEPRSPVARDEIPRPPDSLALVRSVVLLL